MGRQKCLTCRKSASFGLKGGKIEYCRTCKSENMINLSNISCLECDRPARYNIEKPPRYCSDHKKEEMVDVCSQKCKECNKQPQYNFEGYKSGMYCSEHKKEGMINVKKSKCETCGKRANFNYKDKKKGMYCKEHALKDMINVDKKNCKFENCFIGPCFNFPNQKNGLYCVKHKLDGMIDVENKDRKCKECDSQANYGIKGNKPSNCAKHRTEDMVRIYGNFCLECDTLATFNYKGENKGKYCVKHKFENMIDVISKKCEFENCNIQPIYNFKHLSEGKYCAKHKENGMVDVSNGTCKTEMCDTSLSNKSYEGYCFRCFVNLFPDKPISNNRRVKERDVIQCIKTTFSEIDWEFDKIVGKSKRRPDALHRNKHFNLIVEIDEEQHNSYDCMCEDRRMMEISQDLNFVPTIFIRFNPDKYTDSKGKEIKSPWRLINGELMLVSKTSKKDWTNRCNLLIDTISYWLKQGTDKTIEIIPLFY